MTSDGHAVRCAGHHRADLPGTPIAVVPTEDAPGGLSYHSLMERLAAVSELPTSYAVAVRLQDSGAGAGTIATALAIDLEEVAPFLAIAEAKLAAIVGEPD
jgi:hypothetical protein